MMSLLTNMAWRLSTTYSLLQNPIHPSDQSQGLPENQHHNQHRNELPNQRRSPSCRIRPHPAAEQTTMAAMPWT